MNGFSRNGFSSQFRYFVLVPLVWYAAWTCLPARGPALGFQAPASPAKPAAVAPAEPALDWHDVTQWGVEGRAWTDQERHRWFDRFPAAAEGKVTPAVWGLSRDSAGMLVRFQTDATAIWTRYVLRSDRLAMPHMPATGVSGLDLYARMSRACGGG